MIFPKIMNFEVCSLSKSFKKTTYQTLLYRNGHHNYNFSSGFQVIATSNVKMAQIFLALVWKYITKRS